MSPLMIICGVVVGLLYLALALAQRADKAGRTDTEAE
jgi:hypothetical protein